MANKTTPGSLSEFLKSNRTACLAALKEGNAEWVAVMGNEAGDLDSIASSIAYSFFMSHAPQTPVRSVGLLQTPREDLRLRAENLHAFKLALLDDDHTDLLCIDDLPPSSSLSRFALVDHNRLLPRFQGDVVGVIDHHDDEGLYQNANPRLIEPAGSCASLVARHFQSAMEAAKPPPELATLLICAILLDTGGLKPGGKAVESDRQAVSFLFPLSTLALTTSVASDGSLPVKDLANELSEAKGKVSHLSTRDLLRRDYKEYNFHSSSSSRDLRIGLSTVPAGLKDWKDGDDTFWDQLHGWIDERNLQGLGVLNSFRSQKKGKHRRQILFVIKGDDEALVKRFWKGLKNDKDLELERLDDFEVVERDGWKARAWKQGNVQATRKAIAPLVKTLAEA